VTGAGSVTKMPGSPRLIPSSSSLPITQPFAVERKWVYTRLSHHSRRSGEADTGTGVTEVRLRAGPVSSSLIWDRTSGVPELPEVETVARQLEPELEGHAIEKLEVRDKRWSRPVRPATLGKKVDGRTILGLGRRGKYLLLALDGDQTLVMHLRMTGNLVLVEDEGEIIDPSEGRLLYQGERTTEEKHLRARFVLDDGREVWFTDPRRFGEAFLIDDAKLPERFSRLGVEPLSPEFTPERLGEIAAGKRAPLKSFLLDQSGIAGVGNIYADEALFRARLHPLSPAGSMKPEHWAALRDGVVAALEAGIDAGGSSIDDYRDGRGEKGQMQERFLVHTREGEPCPGEDCDGVVERIVVSGRSTYFCPSCQVKLRRRPKRHKAKAKVER
jgi:formamidopyrimidine-DNA glycosylase